MKHVKDCGCGYRVTTLLDKWTATYEKDSNIVDKRCLEASKNIQEKN